MSLTSIHSVLNVNKAYYFSESFILVGKNHVSEDIMIVLRIWTSVLFVLNRHWWLFVKNIAKGITDLRVEFSLPK